MYFSSVSFLSANNIIGYFINKYQKGMSDQDHQCNDGWCMNTFTFIKTLDWTKWIIIAKERTKRSCWVKTTSQSPIFLRNFLGWKWQEARGSRTLLEILGKCCVKTSSWCCQVCNNKLDSLPQKICCYSSEENLKPGQQ